MDMRVCRADSGKGDAHALTLLGAPFMA
jgi:hypothetical protein